MKFKREFAKNFLSKCSEVREWYASHIREAEPAFYCSVDLRDAGDKIVPVDNNLYPGGFNNICNADQLSGEKLFQHHLESFQKILILPESHTRNLNYAENLSSLLTMIRGAGKEAQIGWLGEEKTILPTASGGEVSATPLTISSDGTVSAGDFHPDLILLNNDFSGGTPKILEKTKQPIVPTPALGWHSRKKTTHFVHYNRLAGEFAKLLGIDPWSIQVDTTEVSPVNLNEGVGMEKLHEEAAKMFERLESSYAQRKIKRKPFIFVKNNAGTYGMGILVAHSADELLEMNRRTKNKMSVGKNRSAITSLALQEGVPTMTRVDRVPAEPVIYLLGMDLLGGFLRTNSLKGDEDNLNSDGMVFKKLCMSDLQGLARESLDPGEGEEAFPGGEERILEVVYGAIARLSALATGYEIRENGPPNGNHTLS